MNNVARRRDDDPVLQDMGTISEVDGAVFVVRTPSGDVAAGRAASCLLEPRAGDRVLLVGCRRGGYYILAILTREDGARAALTVDGDLEIRLPTGRLVMAAQEGLELVSPKDTTITSGTVSVNAAGGSVAVGRLSFLGTLLQAEVETVKLLAARFDSVVERVSQRLQRSYRSVEESDQVRARRIDYAAKDTMVLHAREAIVTAEGLVKVDGDQIHLG